MLHTELLELLNKGQLVAFIGSGPSTAAGLPTWPQLVEDVIAMLHPDAAARVAADEPFKTFREAQNLPACFERIETLAGRKPLEIALQETLVKVAKPSHATKVLANWPFAAYITTNYDTLIERALRETNTLDWPSLGNDKAHCRKISGAAEHFIWHFHGGINVADNSDFVLTTEDYNALYIDGSPALQHLRGLLMQRRLLYIGFGFRDEQILQELRRIGSICDPSRPAFAFVPHDFTAERILDLRTHHNIECIPLPKVRTGKHPLDHTLDVYSSFVVRRTISFSSRQGTQSYDPETTSLFLYNELVLHRQARPEDAVVAALMESRILSLLGNKERRDVADISEELATKLRLLALPQGRSANSLPADIRAAIEAMRIRGLIELASDETVALTPTGEAEVHNRSQLASNLLDRFHTSLQNRAALAAADLPDSINRICSIAEAFLLDCIHRRSLGLATTMQPGGGDHAAYNITALLQSLPGFMEALANMDEAIALIRVIMEVLGSPSNAEQEYIGAALQAQFCLVMFGYDPNLVRTRLSLVSSTVYFIDSSTLLAYLAKDATGSAAALRLINLLQGLGGTTLCTSGLANEVAEHARFAKNIVEGRPLLSIELLQAAMEQGGDHNYFIDGFVKSLAYGGSFARFDDYLNAICHDNEAHTVKDEVFVRILAKHGIPVVDECVWTQHVGKHLSDVDQIAKTIGEIRRSKLTYKHDRQARNEAEIVLLVRGIRASMSKAFDGGQRTSVFVSNTRILDDLNPGDIPITVRSSALIQWLNALKPCSQTELATMFDSLIAELSGNGFTIVNRTMIKTAFGPYLDLSKERLQEELQRHSDLGLDRFRDFTPAEIDSLDAPIVYESINAQRAVKAEEQLTREREARRQAQIAQSLNTKEKDEYLRLKQEKEDRRKRAKSKRRASQSKPHKSTKAKKISKKEK